MTVRQPTGALLNRLSKAATPRQHTRFSICRSCIASQRDLHSRIAAPPVPKPTPFVPDVQTFLTVIGRKLSQHASKIESWDTLFRLTSSQLRDLGIEPARNRKYLLRWREKFRHREFGIGGDAKHVGEGGAVECRLIETQTPADEGASARAASLTSSPGTSRKVLNVPWTNPLAEKDEVQNSQEASAEKEQKKEAVSETSPQGPQRPPALDDSAIRRAHPIAGVRHKPGHGLYGPYMRIAKGSQGLVGVIEAREGIWEHQRGRKVDGGERRKAEVRFKRASAERRAARK